MLIWNLEFSRTDFTFYFAVVLTRTYSQEFINITNKKEDFCILQSYHRNEKLSFANTPNGSEAEAGSCSTRPSVFLFGGKSAPPHIVSCGTSSAVAHRANATLAFSFCCHSWQNLLSSRIAYLLVARVALARAVQESYAWHDCLAPKRPTCNLPPWFYRFYNRYLPAGTCNSQNSQEHRDMHFALGIILIRIFYGKNFLRLKGIFLLHLTVIRDFARDI